MSLICGNCRKVNDIPTCTNQIIVGTIADIDATLYIYFVTARGQVIRLDGSSDGAGLVTVDTSGLQFMSNMSYEIFITLDAAVSFEDKIDITVPGEADPKSCFQFTPDAVRDTSDNQIAFTTVTLKAV